MSRQRTSRRLNIKQLAAFADTTAEFGETELTRPWAETIIAVAVAAVIAHFSEGVPPSSQVLRPPSSLRSASTRCGAPTPETFPVDLKSRSPD